MNRRGFMSSLLALGMAPAIVRAESLMRIKPILLPGEDFEFASDGVWGAGSSALLTPLLISREALKMLKLNLAAVNLMNRSYEDRFVKIGSTLTIPTLIIRKPNSFT